jgi:glycosyltransferase involved in cell wall biosynthesis
MNKLLHLIPTLEGGGAERQLVMLAVEQSKRGWDVNIGLRRSNGVYSKFLINSKIKIHELGDFKGLNPKLMISIGKLIRNLKPDLVQTWLPQMDVIGGMAATCNAVPLVMTERASHLAFNNFDLSTAIRKRVGRRAKAVVANSSAGMSYWKKNVLNTTILEKIPNAVDVSAIRSAAPISNELIQSNENIMLVVGRLTHQKAVEVVLHAISLLNDREGFKCIIIGEGPLRQDLNELIHTLNIVDSVVMLPFQSEWWGWLKIAKALISMSRYEGNPNVLLEAMGAGCPLIVSDIPEHREILTDKLAIFVPCENSIQLAATINKFFSDLESAYKRSDHARKYVDGLTIQRTADAYEEVYSKIIYRGLVI